MLRISKLTDYGTVLLAHLARNEDTVCSAAEVSQRTGISLPTASKLLKSLARSGIVTSTRGANGGYSLARPARDISAADIIDALEGPVSITECSASDSHCDIRELCAALAAPGSASMWPFAMRYRKSTLVDLLRTSSPVPRFNFGGLPITVEEKT